MVDASNTPRAWYLPCSSARSPRQRRSLLRSFAHQHCGLGRMQWMPCCALPREIVARPRWPRSSSCTSPPLAAERSVYECTNGGKRSTRVVSHVRPPSCWLLLLRPHSIPVLISAQQPSGPHWSSTWVALRRHSKRFAK